MKPIILAIMDGVGLREDNSGNAFNQAIKPNYDRFIDEFPHSRLDASGIMVGLPDGQMGNSEVGHLNIGAGRIVYQPLELINKAIKDGSFSDNLAFKNIIEHVKSNNSKLHIMGLISDGGVHSHIDHIIALLKLAKENNVKVYVHAFMDGRDTLPDKALVYLSQLEQAMIRIGCGTIATVSGRYYAMDRDKRFDRLQLAYDAIVSGIGPKNKNYRDVIAKSFNNNIYDEFIIPTVIDKSGTIHDNDGVIFANFRPDRVIQMGNALTNEHFDGFETKKFKNLKLVTMMPTASSVKAEIAFHLINLDNTLGAYIDSLGLKQLRIAETEKYAHVTYFFDGGKELNLKGCTRSLEKSSKVATYDLKPEMSANEITTKLLKELDNDYDLVILNFANCDMVGHTGNMDATIKAVETVDHDLGLIYDKVNRLGGLLIVTADHGNAELMLDENGHVITAHTTNQVPFIVCSKDYELVDGKLADIAPSILKIMELSIPKEMTGNVIINKKA